MSPEVIAIVVGLLAGWGAASLVKDSGYGMMADFIGAQRRFWSRPGSRTAVRKMRF